MEIQKMAEEQRQEIILAIVYLFFRYGKKEEVKRAELVDCLVAFQKEFPQLGYDFSEKSPYYCYQLTKDLNDLWFKKGYLRYYRSGTPLRKNYVALWPLGKGRAKKMVETMDPEMIESLNRAARAMLNKYQ